MIDHTQLMRDLLPGVHAAGKAIMTHYRAGVVIEDKQDGSPVTAADTEAEAILLDCLQKAAPDVPAISEEAASTGRMPDVHERIFLVDPLDGTREFISGRDEFTVNVGLVDDGVPVFGVIYAPALGKIYMALGETRALMAQLPLRAGNTPGFETLDTAVLRVRDLREGAPLSVSTSRSHGSDAMEAWLAKREVKSRVRVGSSLKFCQIAAGEADVYPRFGTTMEWDTAAGHAIVLAAGGIVKDVDGEPLRYGKAESGFRNRHFIAAAAELPSFFALPGENT